MAEERNISLPEVFSTLADLPTVKTVLQSLRGVLSKSSRIHGAHIYLLGADGKSLRMLDFDRDSNAPDIRVGTRILITGAIQQVLQEQLPVFVPDSATEMLRHPELAPFAAESVGRPTYAFPVSTPTQQYGVLAVTKDAQQEFLPEDVQLLGALASHIAIALECALAKERAEQYQRELARERDRLRLVLEINNHVSKLDMHDVLQSASASIRSYFECHSVAFWLYDEKSGRAKKLLHDFPDGIGLLDTATDADMGSVDWSRLYKSKAECWSRSEFGTLPARFAEALRAESMKSLAFVALTSENRLLGFMSLASPKFDGFGQESLDLLIQISVQISLALQNALAHGQLNASASRLEEEVLYLESEIAAEYNFEDIVGKSAALRKVLDQVAIVAPTSSTVLLHGETGTGKELVARAIHNLSPRRQRTFVRLNCAAIPAGLVESELFGHERGAFTGALTQKKGRFELADRGTFFLDEIGDITMDLQPKILRVLQEQEFERLGSTTTIHVDVRLIAATHRDLPTMIRNQEFREDLFYRLNVFPIEIPPLRERREDIPLLVHFFVSRLSRRMQKRIRSVPKQAMERLVNADWPGNIRELQNFIERCMILTQGDELNVPRTELTRSAARSTVATVSTFEHAEKQAIVHALRTASGRIAGKGGAAEQLGLKRTTLQNKMRKLSISRADYSA